jgi:hypothetical protein
MTYRESKAIITFILNTDYRLPITDYRLLITDYLFLYRYTITPFRPYPSHSIIALRHLSAA